MNIGTNFTPFLNMTMCENTQTRISFIAVVWVGVAIWVAVKRVQDGRSQLSYVVDS